MEEFQPEKTPYKQASLATRVIWGSIRFILFCMVLIVFVFGGLLVYVRWQEAGKGSVIEIDGGDDNLGSAEKLVLQAYLSYNAKNLSDPAGNSTTPIPFTISAGQNANQIALNMSSEGIILPEYESLFINYLRFYGLDAALDAGTYQIEARSTIPDIVQAFTKNSFSEIELGFLEGWRTEQLVEYFNVVRPARIDPAEFLGIVRRSQPFDITPYPFLSELGPNDSLEGYLFPGSYIVPVEADATYIVTQMLNSFGQQVTPAMRQAYGSQGLTLNQAVNLAAIVQREAIVPAEQPIIAGVFINRLNLEMKLDADPTVQYALGYYPESDTWWKSPLSLTDLEVASPFNTYANTGLPPHPIANPGLGALQAVAAPSVTDYLFFVGGCTSVGPGIHIFSSTFEEHLTNVQTCQ